MFVHVLRPFSAFMSRLRYGQKFAFVSLLMAIPIAMLLVIWLSEQQQELAFIEKERIGASQINEVMPFMLLVQQHRGLANGYLNGNTQSISELDKKEQEISEVIALMEKSERLQAFPDSYQKWTSLKSDWNQLAGNFRTLTPKESFDMHSSLIDQVEELIVSYSDESGLSLDTEMDSFYLMTMLVQQLPVLMENTAVIRGQGNGVLVSKQLSEEMKINLLLEMAKMDAAFKDLNKSLAIVTALDTELNKEIRLTGEQSIEATNKFQTLVNKEIIEASEIKKSGEDFFAEGTATIGVLNQMFTRVNGELERILSARSGELNQSRNFILAVTLLSLLLAALFYAGFYRNVIDTVNALKKRAQEMSMGDLSYELQLNTRDELQQAGHAFNEMLHSLNELLRRNQRISEKTAASSGQLMDISHESTSAMKLIATAIQSVSSGTELQSLSTSETATAMNEMAIGITRIAEAASEAADAAAKANEKLRLGDEQLEETALQMNSIKSTQVESAQIVAKLNEHSVQIGQIVATVMSIAKQTQLLALNANIEAARAGEHGRGFSVVASEVGKLAEQTAHSVDSISHLLSSVRMQVDETVLAMDAMREETDTGLQVIGRTQQTMSSILTDIRQMSDQVQEVSAASEQISAGMEQVTAAIGEVASVSHKTSDDAETMAAATEQQLASMEEIQTSAEALSMMSRQLQEDLSRFVLASE
ncbi:methyl-accepting chemotaxis protein [Paenibacillus sp. LHD-38]|uniref:methyl-accepting chemotaxis protein n=1 Tax=Paenibacillus sp. LHD-38 TaxID=3072143 RepID=UPI00280D1AC8|nr:methyl-accepting chemotaxis protein [Paenibacillus sp. LHD-38]MDQ8737700.1 methyl-accepting chemotaxis protein [Paenibacillus sp. LHD-38]